MALTDPEYLVWRLDSSNDPYRILLIEADYNGGTVRIGSRAWLSNAHLAYDDWLLGLPFMESVLDDIGGIGDFDAINRDPVVNWNQFDWHGFECRWSYGDIRWRQEDFRIIGTSLIDEVRAQGQLIHSFQLMDLGQALTRSLVTTNTTRTEAISAAIEWLSTQTGVSIQVMDLDSAKLAWNISYDMTPTTSALDVLKMIARSMNAHFRVDQHGNVDLIGFSAVGALELNVDMISADRLSVVEVIHPYSVVTLIKSDGTRIDGDTDVVTGRVLEQIDISTALTSTTDVDTLMDEYLDYYANVHQVWSIPVSTFTDVISAGRAVTIQHPELRDTGMVQRIMRSPLSSATDIEVLI